MRSIQHLRDATRTGPLFTAAETPSKRRAAAMLESLVEHATKDGAFAKIINLTPELAELLLERNAQNRPKRSGVINDIATDIETGRWELNGETVIVSNTGELNDGQNRCEAVVKAGRAVHTFMVFGVSRKSRRAVDSTQTTRTPGDFVAMDAISDGNNVAAVAGYLWQVDKFGEIPVPAHTQGHRPTKPELSDYRDRHLAKIQQASSSVPSVGANRVASRSILSVAYALIARESNDHEAMKEYFKLVVGGADPKTQPGIHVARERLMDEKRKRALWPHKAVEILLRGWNFHRTRQRPKKMQLMDAWPRIAR